MTYIATFHVQGGVDEFTSNYSSSEELRFELRSPRDIPAMLSAVDLARKLSLDHAGDPSNDRLTTVTLLELANSKGIVLDQKEVAIIATLPSLEEARAKIVGILATPAQKIVSILLAPGSKIANLARAKSLKN